MKTKLHSFKEKRRIHAIFFDFDGTIIKSTFQAKEAKAALIQKLKKLGLDTSDITMNDTTMEILRKAERQVIKNGKLSLESLRGSTSAILDKFDIKAFSQSELILGAKSVINRLRKAGFKLGLITSSGRRGVKIALEKFSLKGYFDVVVTRNDVKRIKPSGESIRKALSILGYAPNEVAYVGDSWVDILAAKDAGVMAVAVVGGLSPKERLLQASPDVIIFSLKELLTMFSEKQGCS